MRVRDRLSNSCAQTTPLSYLQMGCLSRSSTHSALSCSTFFTPRFSVAKNSKQATQRLTLAETSRRLWTRSTRRSSSDIPGLGTLRMVFLVTGLVYILLSTIPTPVVICLRAPQLRHYHMALLQHRPYVQIGSITKHASKANFVLGRCNWIVERDERLR